MFCTGPPGDYVVEALFLLTFTFLYDGRLGFLIDERHSKNV
jgi:hypothetical protein